MRNGNRFEQGSGCYECESCKKKTRSTGRGDNEHVGLCEECYDRAGDENAVSDGLMTQAEFDAIWNKEKQGDPHFAGPSSTRLPAEKENAMQLEAMNVKGLRAYAKEHGIKLPRTATKREQLLTILAPVAEAKPPVDPAPKPPRPTKQELGILKQICKHKENKGKNPVNKMVHSAGILGPGAGRVLPNMVAKGWVQIDRAEKPIDNKISILKAGMELLREYGPEVADVPQRQTKFKSEKEKAKPGRKGLGIADKWLSIFLENEASFGKDGKALTDEQITEAMNAAFPDRKSEVFKQVALVRNRFNRQACPGVTLNYDQTFHRYVLGPDGKTYRATARGVALDAKGYPAKFPAPAEAK